MRFDVVRPAASAEDEAVLALLPAGLAEVARVTSVAAALALANQYRGRRMYVPEVMTAIHPIAQLIGLDAAATLAYRYGRETLEMPVLRNWHVAIKTRAIASARRAGRTQAELAAEYGMTERGIRFAERRADDVSDPDQYRLFSDG